MNVVVHDATQRREVGRRFRRAPQRIRKGPPLSRTRMPTAMARGESGGGSWSVGWEPGLARCTRVSSYPLTRTPW